MNQELNPIIPYLLNLRQGLRRRPGIPPFLSESTLVKRVLVACLRVGRMLALAIVVLMTMTGGRSRGFAPAYNPLSDVQAAPAAATGQVIVDPTNPSWFKYSGGGPFYMCGPGDPEGFLYRGSRNPDGTRNGDQLDLIGKLADTGANSIYLMAVRSNGGDGDSTQNPFVDSNPANGLDQDILDQWNTWFDAMDKAGIVIFFIFYDDSARIWNTGDIVGSQESAFIQGLINAFKSKNHLVWVVAEEYQESYSSARVSNIAEEIRAADDMDHPIAVHKTIGLGFSDFANDPNIDQFAVQYSSNTSKGFHNAMVSAWANANGRYSLNLAEGHPDAFGSQARLRSWAAAMGGAYVMHVRWDIASTDTNDLKDCGRLVSFMESLPLNKMSPHDELAFGATDYVLANPGEDYVAYAANRNGDMGLKGIEAGTYDFTWLNITNGEYVKQVGISVGAGSQSWSAPSGIGNELAVYLHRTGGPTAEIGGDLNSDGVVDIADVQACAAVVLGMTTDPNVVGHADVNNDGKVDIRDVQTIVNVVLKD